jgi:hypothetical protein
MADVVVIPGLRHGSGAPLPMYAGDLAGSRGATVHRHDWVGRPPRPMEAFAPAARRWVVAQISPLLDRIGGRPLLIGKSLGGNAAWLAAERDLPAVWLTPVLEAPEMVTALGRATAPFLLVGGTADRGWVGPVARRLTPHVFEVDGADHGMYVPGPVTASIAVLAQVVDAVAEFFDEIGWPDEAVVRRTVPGGTG